jgi:hypothetical protein
MKTLQDDNAYSDKWSCECKTWQGIDKKGLICPFCHTEVKFIGDNFEIFGWIKLNEPYKIIHPNLYQIIQSYFGNDNLQAILEPDIELNTNGTKMTSWERKAFKKKMANKKKFTKHSNSDKTYAGIGMMQFMEQFDEILEYFHKKNGTKKIEIYNDYCDENKGGEDKINLFDEEFFDTNFSNPMDAARAVYFGSIENWSDEYIRFNAYGNLVSLTEYDVKEIINDNIEEIFKHFNNFTNFICSANIFYNINI